MLKEKLSENERIMQEMSLTWEQKRFKTGKSNYQSQMGVYTKVLPTRVFVICFLIVFFN